MCALVSACDFSHKIFLRPTLCHNISSIFTADGSPTVQNLSLFDRLPAHLGQFQRQADMSRIPLKGLCAALWPYGSFLEAEYQGVELPGNRFVSFFIRTDKSFSKMPVASQPPQELPPPPLFVPFLLAVDTLCPCELVHILHHMDSFSQPLANLPGGFHAASTDEQVIFFHET